MDPNPLAACTAAVAALSLLPAQEDPGTPLVSGNHAFTADLHRWIATGRRAENAVFSPLSIRMALAMLRSGASGRTRSEIDGAARFGTETDLAAAYDDLIERSSPPDDDEETPWQLAVANAAWVQDGFGLKEDYVERIASGFDAAIRTLDFEADPEPCRLTINGWVSERTAGRIEDLIPAGMLSNDTRLVLTNAMHFQAPWSESFQPEDSPRTFHAPGGDVERTFFGARRELRSAVVDGAAAVEVPFRGHRLAMVFVLPPEDSDLPRFEQQLDDVRLTGLLESLREARPTLVDLSIPRFEIRMPLPLNDALRDLGMKRAFTGEAQFDRMASEALFVSDVIHQAFVKVDEKGAEAAAATAIAMVKGSLPTGEPFPFVADRPFLFAIVERASGTVLFFGRCARP